MEQVILLLHFREEDYGRRFLRFINGKKHPQIHTELVTDREKALRRVGKATDRLVIVTDDETMEEDGKRELILLTGEQNRKEKKIFQYQCAEKIYDELTALLGIEKKMPERVEPEQGEGVVILFSPEGIPLTELAVLMSQYLGKQGRCLYICLSGFPIYYAGEFQKEPDYQTPGIGELMLCPAEEMLHDKLQQLVRTFGSAEMLPPFSHYKDMLDCTADDWKLFLERIRKEGRYDSVIVEMGTLFESMTDLLEFADRLFVVGREDAFGKLRTEAFRRYCRMEKKDSIVAMAECVPMPEEAEEWRKNLFLQPLSEWAENSQLMGKIRNLLENRKEEEDVCLWEDFE